MGQLTLSIPSVETLVELLQHTDAKDEIENSRRGQLFPSSVAQSLNGEEIGDRLLQGEEFITLVKYRKLKAHLYFVSLSIYRRLPGRRALVVVFIKNMLLEIIAFVVFECL